jgi:hypothetical protein
MTTLKKKRKICDHSSLPVLLLQSRTLVVGIAKVFKKLLIRLAKLIRYINCEWARIIYRHKH